MLDYIVNLYKTQSKQHSAALEWSWQISTQVKYNYNLNYVLVHLILILLLLWKQRELLKKDFKFKYDVQHDKIE